MSGHKLLIGALVVFLLFGAGMAPAAESKPAISSGGGKQASNQINASQQSTDGNSGPAKQSKIVKVTGTLRHGKTIEVELQDDEKLLEKNSELTKYVLLVDSIEIVKGAGLFGGNTLVFNIDNKTVPKEAWGKIARCFAEKESIFRPEANVEVGYAQKFRISGEKDFILHYIEPWEFWMFLAIYAALLVVFVCLVVTTSILRDATQKIKEVRKRTFSLGKSQMAFWFFIVLPSFFFIWLITGSTASLTGSTLILLSISSLTTLISGYVDKNKEDKKNVELPKLEQKKGNLESRKVELHGALKTSSEEDKAKLSGENKAIEDQLEQIQEQVAAAQPTETQGFIKDILRDRNNINLHRLQCAVWTLVLGYIFISTTICSLTMPEFSATLLALLGISNGTYVALKVPEK